MSTLHPAHDANRSSDVQTRKRLPLWIRIAAWTGAVLVSLAILAVVTGTYIVHSRRFHDYVLAKVERQASDRLGTQVRIENFTVRLSTLSLDIYGLTIHGAPPYPDPPLLQVQHAEVGVRVVSVFRGISAAFASTARS
jgi:translocation and assembly module TamB